MAVNILVRIPRQSQRFVLALACEVAALVALGGACLIIVWTAELFR